MKQLIVTLAFAISLALPVSAQDLGKGWAAYSAGDYATALKEWKPLAETGNEVAQYNLGIMYKNGQGVPQDYAEALKWYRLAAEQGYAQAQGNLGFMYDNGQGVPQDYKEAVKWYRLAAEQGYAIAQNNLGITYEYGKGVLQDNVMAHMWYNIASANSNPIAGDYRDERAGLMTQADISKAQAMARECMNSGYKKCGY